MEKGLEQQSETLSSSSYKVQLLSDVKKSIDYLQLHSKKIGLSHKNGNVKLHYGFTASKAVGTFVGLWPVVVIIGVAIFGGQLL